MVTQHNGGGVVVLRQPTAVAARVARWVAALLVFYGGAWVTSRGVLWLTVDVLGRTIAPLPSRELVVLVPAFFGFFMPVLYLGCSALAGRWLRPRWDTLVLYVGNVTQPGNVCDSIDFNNDGLFPDTVDIDDFLSVFSGGSCSTGTCGEVDFNNDGLFPDTADIDSLLSVFSGGACL